MNKYCFTTGNSNKAIPLYRVLKRSKHKMHISFGYSIILQIYPAEKLSYLYTEASIYIYDVHWNSVLTRSKAGNKLCFINRETVK